jgi:hypothetical protein
MVAITTAILTQTLSSNIALKKVVKAPHIIANALDWKIRSGIPATALTIDIHTDRIGLALAITNSNYFNCKVLDSIPLVRTTSSSTSSSTTNKRRRIVVSSEDKRRLSGLVQEHSISGFIVSWPLQKDTGLMGASCGRTLFTIEQLLLEEDDADDGNDYTKIFTRNRPICFWDGGRGMHNNNNNNNDDNNKTEQHEEQPKIDAFGRCSIYARTSTKKEHYASKEQYYLQNEFSAMNAMKVWEDFYQTHWPITVTTITHNNNNNAVVDNDIDIDMQQQEQQKQKRQRKKLIEEEEKRQQQGENNHHIDQNNNNSNNDDIFTVSSLVQQPSNNSNNNNNNNNNAAELLSSSPYISTRRRRTLAATTLVSMA